MQVLREGAIFCEHAEEAKGNSCTAELIPLAVSSHLICILGRSLCEDWKAVLRS